MVPKKILVVSQNIAQTTILFDCLQKSGYQVLVASQGQSALESIQRQRPDLAILDWSPSRPLPELNSLALIRMIRADPEVAKLPIMLRGTDMKEEDFMLALEAGADACLREPFHPAIFIARVRAVLRRCHASELSAQ